LGPLQTLVLILVLWAVAVSACRVLHLEEHGLEAHPLYIIYRSHRLNDLLSRLASWNPSLWRVFGDVAVAMAFGQMAFLGWLLVRNLLHLFLNPSSASPMLPLIPGVTIKPQSIPYFLTAASVIILLHELSHGVLCAVEGVRVRNSALLLAVFFFGGAIQPDEGEMERKEGLGRMRIYAVGSLTNLALGLITFALSLLLGGRLPRPLSLLLQWTYFLSINLAIVNMLPTYPFDGDGMLNALFKRFRDHGEALRRITGGSFLLLVLSNMAMSLLKFGLISF